MKKLLILAATIACAGAVYAGPPVSGDVVPQENKAVSFTKDVDAGELDRFSMQVNYSTAQISAATITDGTKSTAQITVVSGGLSSLSARVAQSSITVVNNALVSGVVITIAGQSFTEGNHWSAGSHSSMTAVSLKNAIDANPGLAASTGTVGSSNIVVFASVTVAGIAGNSTPITTSNAAAIMVQGPTFVGGQNNATITVNQTTLTQGTDWTVGATALLTARSISNAIVASSATTMVVSSHTSAGVVYATATLVGVNQYALSTSSYPALTPSTNLFSGGAASDIDIDNNTISETGHQFTTGLKVLLSTATAPSGLTSGTTYFVIKTTPNEFKLAVVSSDAVSGTAIDITAVTGGNTWTLAPLANSLTGAGFNWQASNDGSTWATLVVSSQALTAIGDGTRLWDFGQYAYRFLRLNFTGPSQGAINLRAIINGKREGPE